MEKVASAANKSALNLYSTEEAMLAKSLRCCSAFVRRGSCVRAKAVHGSRWSSGLTPGRGAYLL